jgi:catechol 2,3-dioxygenase-like lactoylglutathione lyase family enzyme
MVLGRNEVYIHRFRVRSPAFWREDVRRSNEKVLVGGATLAIEPWDEGGYTLAFVRDQDGVWIELVGNMVRLVSHKGSRKSSWLSSSGTEDS